MADKVWALVTEQYAQNNIEVFISWRVLLLEYCKRKNNGSWA